MNKTITRIFLLPTVLSINIKELRENGLINAYISDSTTDIHFENSIFLLFKPEFPDKFRKFLNKEFNSNESIIAAYDKFGGMIVLVYRLNPIFNDDYELVKQSNYSKTSQKFQKLFPRYVEIMTNGVYKKEVSLQYRIFNKTIDLLLYWNEKNPNYNTDNEVWHVFDTKNEILTKDILNDIALQGFK
jgi:hypothetical protein